MSFSQSDDRAPNEQRNSYRCAVSGSRRDGRLKIGDRELAAEILDESAGGYSILLDEAPDCAVGAVALLKSASGWAEVQIMSLHLLEPAASDESADAVPKVQTRLGLMRLRTVEEVDDSTDLAEELRWLSLKALSGFFGVAARSLTTTVGVTIGALVLGVLLILGIERSIPLIPVLDAELKQATDHSNASPPSPQAAAAKKWHIKVDVAPTVPHAVPHVTTSAKEPIGASAKTNRSSQFDELRSVLENPEIRELPGLSREQIRRLRDWADEYRKKVRRPDAAAPETGANTSADPSGTLPDRLEFLTEEQQRALSQLLSTADAPEKPAAPGERPTEDTPE